VRIACSLTTALVRADLRSLAVAISDANGAEVAFTSPLEIANQPPSITLRPDFADGLLAIDHRVEACAVASGTACFVADAADPFVVVDPDGDPLSGYRLGVTVSPDRTSSYGTASVDGADYRFRFETPTSLPAEFRSDTNATGFTVSASVTDAFGAATGVALPLAVLNRAPTVLEAVAAAEIPHGYDLATRSYRASADGPLFADPDGDPLVPSVLPSTVCSRVTLDQGRANLGCELAWDFMVGGVPPLASFLGARSIPVTASDGWQRATSVVAVTILDRPATISAPTRVIENCGCFKEPDACGYWAPWGAVRVPVQVVDPDGDPALVTALASRSIVDPPVPIMCPGGWCYPAAAFLETSATGVAKATSGEGISASAPFSVTVTCVSSNLPCGCP
jgi:hypothetical protein